jgi:hypothetical protein
MIEKGNCISKIFKYVNEYEKSFFVFANVVDSSSNICLKYILDERACEIQDYYYLKIVDKPIQGFLKTPAHIRMLQTDSVNFNNYINTIIDFSLFKAYITEKKIFNKDSIINAYVHFLKYNPMSTFDRTSQKLYKLNYNVTNLQLPFDMAVENVYRTGKIEQGVNYKRISSIEDIRQIASAYPECYKQLDEIDIDFQDRIDWFFNWGLLSINCQINGEELISVDVKVLYSYESAMSSITKDGLVEFRSKTSNAPLKVGFMNAFCVNLERTVDAHTRLSTGLVISPDEITINGISFDNNWVK